MYVAEALAPTHGSRLLPEVLSSQVTMVPSTRSLGLYFSFNVKSCSKGKSEATKGKGRARERVNVARDAQSQLALLFFPLLFSETL